MTKKAAAARGRTSTQSAALRRSLARGLRQAVAYERGELKRRVEVYNLQGAVDEALFRKAS
jgi:hypothetical protein